MLVGSMSRGTKMKWFRRSHRILLSATMTAIFVLVWGGHSALAAGDRGWEVAIFGATEDMSARDFERIVIEAFPPGLLDPEINFTRSSAYRPASQYRLIRSEEKTSELQPLISFSYAAFCLKTQQQQKLTTDNT